MPSKRVRVHYRRFLRSSDPALDGLLSAAVGTALSSRVEGIMLDDDVALRTYVDPDYGSVILNGRFVAANGGVFGELVRFDPETNIPLLMQNSTSRAELEVRELVKPNDAEVLRGMTFFLLREDHVLVIEQELSNTVMERYFRWLLTERTNILREGRRFSLIPKSFLGEELQSVPDVKLIRLKPGRLNAGELAFSERKELSHASKKLEHTTSILGILKAANFNTTIIEKVMQENAASVEMNLTISLKAGRSTLKIEGDDAMCMLRNVPEDDLILVGEGIRRNRGVYERLSDETTVEKKGDILDRKDAWRVLQEAARAYSSAGLI